MATFKPGETVYTEDASECVYVAPAPDGHIVRSVLDCEDPSEGPYLGPPEVHWRVSKTPPKDRYSAEAAAVKAELEELQAKLTDTRRELTALQAERVAALKALASHPQLQPVLEYIEGRLTHAAVFGTYGTGIRILSLVDALRPPEQREERNGYVRLLSLYGGKHGPAGAPKYSYEDNLTWRINRYSDGSGNDSHFCILGPSEEVVRQRLQAFLDANWDKRGVWNERTIEAWAESAIGLGLQVPANLASKVAEDQAKGRQLRVENARKGIESARQQLSKYEQELADAEAAALAQA